MIKKEFILALSEFEYQPFKLIEHLVAVNDAYRKKHYMNCAILIRVILDYIPTIFWFENVLQIISSWTKDQKTFKKALKWLNEAIRNVADDAMHSPASKWEILKIWKQTIDNQTWNLLLVIENAIKQLKTNDLRDSVVFVRQANPKEPKKEKSKLELFEQYIEKEVWYNEDIDHEKRWICKKDELYQIHEKQDYEDFSEPWTQVYPDALWSWKHSVHLVYNNNIIKTFTFIYCDGWRISVALPKMESDEKNNIWEGKDKLGWGYKNISFYWIKDSFDYKLTKLIWSFYIYDWIEWIAKSSKIKIK